MNGFGKTPFPRHQTSAMSHEAGVDPFEFHVFRVGQRVMTCDGLPGIIDRVLDGPIPFTEAYEVVLDEDLGGGTYEAVELTLLSSQTTTASLGDQYETVPHVASDDYAELTEILVARPPLQRSIAVEAGNPNNSWVVVDSQGGVVEDGFLSADEAANARDELIAVNGGTFFVELDPSSSIGKTSPIETYTGFDAGLYEEYPMATFGSVTPVEIRTEAGVVDWAVDEINDRMPAHIKDDNKGAWSFDWCRYRRKEHCWYPETIDWKASQEAGYIVWNPVDRGFCQRAKWEEQKECPLAEPGPNSGEPNSLVDATRPWDQGGFRQAALAESPEVLLEKEARNSPDFGFHFTAAWADVQRKAKQIRSNGGVRILAVTDNQVTGNVKGSTGVYQTSLTREPGKQAVAMWSCGCAWATYSWGRSGRWKKYEGRMCAHALALNYEVQSRGWQGGTVTEDANSPGWDKDVKLPGDRSKPGEWLRGKPKAAHKIAMAPIKANPSMDDIVSWYIAQAQTEEPRLTRAIKDLAVHNGGLAEGLEFRFKAPKKIKEKIERKGYSGGDPRVWIDDALRYTIVFHPAIYSSQVQDTLYGLEEAGYQIIEEENSWPKGDSYSDLKYIIEGPTGIHAEIQFHTGESLKLKQQTLHVMYEEFRNVKTPLPRKQELFDIMAKYWDEIEIPKDVLNFPKLKIYPRPASLDPSLRTSLASAIQSSGAVLEIGRYMGREVGVIGLLPNGEVLLSGDRSAPASNVFHPKFDPRKGLSVSGSTTNDMTAILHETPEPALPVALGGENSDEDLLEDDASTVRPVASLQNGLEWLMGGGAPQAGGSDSADIAKAAADFLATGQPPSIQTVSAKTFSRAEQQQIIDEGQGVRAGNLDRLDIAGTHYEALASLDDNDLW